jgi:PKD repeat protein
MRATLVILFSLFLFSSCHKEHHGGCIPAPSAETKWKVTKRFGGIAAMEHPLTDDQKNSVLTITTNGNYTCINTVTGQTVSGTYTSVNFSSIYGEKPRFIFTPALPVLPGEFMILLDNQTGLMVFGDNLTDGIQTTFTSVQ